MGVLKKLITFRFDPDLLARAKRIAQRENRTLTNFVETALKRAIDGGKLGDGQTVAPISGKRSRRQLNPSSAEQRLERDNFQERR